MVIKLEKTQRGFMRAEWLDLYGNECSIQESSLATDNAIWLGVHKPSPGHREKESSRMHLNQEQVAALIPLLQHFVETGQLPDV